MIVSDYIVPDTDANTQREKCESSELISDDTRTVSINNTSIESLVVGICVELEYTVEEML